MENSTETIKQPEQEDRVSLWRSKSVRREILITFGLIVIYRFLQNIPLPGLNPEIVGATAEPTSGLHTLASFISMLSGGALLSLSVLALGLFPFLAVYSILPLLAPDFPSLQRRLYEDQRAGQRWLIKWTYYLSILMALLLSYYYIRVLNRDGNLFISKDNGTILSFLPTLTAIAVLTAGSLFAVWIAELINEYGIKGQGFGIVIVSGIIGGLPREIGNLVYTSWSTASIVLYIVLFVSSVVGLIYLLNGTRKIAIMYPHKSQIFYAMSRGKTAKMPQPYLPLQLELGTEGFTGSQILLSLAALAMFLVSHINFSWFNAAASWVTNVFRQDGLFFGLAVFISVVVYTGFYADVVMEQQNYGDNLKRSGAQIPGVHTGTATQKYIQGINRRLMFAVGLAIGFIAIAPWIFNKVFGAELSVFEGERIVIVVTLIHQIQKQIRQELTLQK